MTYRNREPSASPVNAEATSRNFLTENPAEPEQRLCRPDNQPGRYCTNQPYFVIDVKTHHPAHTECQNCAAQDKDILHQACWQNNAQEYEQGQDDEATKLRQKRVGITVSRRLR